MPLLGGAFCLEARVTGSVLPAVHWSHARNRPAAASACMHAWRLYRLTRGPACLHRHMCTRALSCKNQTYHHHRVVAKPPKQACRTRATRHLSCSSHHRHAHAHSHAHAAGGLASSKVQRQTVDRGTWCRAAALDGAAGVADAHLADRVAAKPCITASVLLWPSGLGANLPELFPAVWIYLRKPKPNEKPPTH